MPTLEIFHGSILDAPCKAIVISIWENGILQWATAKAVGEKFWPKLQEQLLAMAPIAKWEVRHIHMEGYDLFFGRPFDYRIRQMTILGVESVIRNSLKIANTLWISEMALSAISENYMPNNENQINAITHLAISSFFEENPNHSVKKIYLVNFNKEVFRL